MTRLTSYWGRNKWQRPIRHVEEYDGVASVSISCTQTELSQTAQKKLVDSWCEELPRLKKLKHVWFATQMPQRLFDAACQIPALETLGVKWSSIKTLDSLSGATSLKDFHLGSSTQVASIAPLAQLTQLHWLGLENLKLISDLSPLESLTNLAGLSFTGGMWGKPGVVSLKPLASLSSLRSLAIHSLHVTDESLRPIGQLTGLEYLSLPNFYPVEEYAFIKASLPNIDYSIDALVDLSRMGIHCKKCKKTTTVMTVGKGHRTLCRTCDAGLVAQTEAHFNALVAAFLRTPCT
jgi:hypothetical protein